MSIELLDIKEKKRIFKDYCDNKGTINMVPYVNFLFGPNKNTGNCDEIRMKVFGLKKEESFRMACHFLHNNADIERATKAHGKPVKTKEFGEFGETLDALYTFIIKVDGKIVMFHADDRGTSFEIEAAEDISLFDDGPKECNEYFYSVYEQVLVHLKESYSEDFDKYMEIQNNAK